MTKGFIQFICGDVGSGKTSLLIEKIKAAGGKSLVITPAFFDGKSQEPPLMGEIRVKSAQGDLADDYDDSEGLSYPAVIASSAEDLLGLFAYDFVFIDDIHLFKAPYFRGDILAFVRKMAADGAGVFVAGRRLDEAGNPFTLSFLLEREATMITDLSGNTGKERVAGAVAL